MKLYIDNREPIEIINEIKDILNKFKFNIELILTNLLLFDFLITNDEFNLNNFENNLHNIIIAIERKSENDLISSIKDGRYKEQSCRMQNINLSNDKIYYLIEESKSNLKNKDTERKIIISAIISLSYFKNFSIIYSKNKLESAYVICKFIEKINSALNHDNKNKNIICINTDNNINNDSNKDSNDYSNIDSNDYSNNDSNDQSNNEYLKNIKINKKDNITPDNIDIVMLMQIPNISNNIAIELINKYNSIQNIIVNLSNNQNILDDFKINNRKISKTVINNLKIYLHI